MDEDSTSAYTQNFPAQLNLGADVWLDRLSDKYKFEKPNDRRALDLMNAAAVSVMKDLPDLIIAYGVSDEYRFVVQSPFFWHDLYTDKTV